MSRLPFFIRCATISDFPQVVKLDHETLSPYGIATSPEIIRARLDVFREGFVVLEQDDDLIGYASAEKWLAENEPAYPENPYVTHYDEGQIFSITSLTVRRQHQRQGFGAALLQYLMDIAHKHAVTQIRAEALPQAQRFFLKHGFQKVGARQQRQMLFARLKLELKGAF